MSGHAGSHHGASDQEQLGTRRYINKLLCGNGPSAARSLALFGLEVCPHGDTLNTAFGRLEAEERRETVTWRARAYGGSPISRSSPMASSR